MRHRFWLLWLAAAALTAAGCGSETVTSVAVAHMPGAVHTRAAGERVAVAVLDRLKVPPNAKLMGTAPSSAIAHPPLTPATPNLAQATHFATAPGTVAGVFAFFEHHHPVGYTKDMSGTGSSDTGAGQVSTLLENLTGMPAGVASAMLLVSVASTSPGRVGIRLDAQVTWIPTKPAGLTVPVADTTVVVAVTEAASPSQIATEHLPVPRRVVVSDPARVRALRQAADGLAPALPEGAHSCPLSLGTGYVVAFAASSTAPPDMVFTPSLCGGVEVTGRRGQRLDVLSNDTAFTLAYERVLGLGG
ncbi:MAG: hypothetical protein ACYC1D_05835 [Acidimicrobiales bacterium]